MPWIHSKREQLDCMEVEKMNIFRFNQVIDVKATGENIRKLRQKRGLSVKDVQAFFGFEMPQAIYRWEAGINLPTVDNLYLLAGLLGVKIDDILIPRQFGGPPPRSIGSRNPDPFLFAGCFRLIAA